MEQKSPKKPIDNLLKKNIFIVDENHELSYRD
jgi:hypothetical protein